MSRLAAVQMASGPNRQANLIEAGRLIADAARSGAELVALPENFGLMGMVDDDLVTAAEADGEGPLQEFLAEQARRNGIWLVGGTVPIASADGTRARPACLVFDDRGQRVARYDKIHLFDVHLPDSGESYTESRTLEPGEAVVTLDSPFGRLGLAVCYDLRFPELFREMVAAGAETFIVPSAFTAITGRAHWEVLTRARAIENLCYLVAPAQGGYHANGRQTWGHSAIIDPWGSVLDRLPNGSGVVVADRNADYQRSVRRTFPALEHRRR
ncbi:nitrilase [Thiohalospira halophila DSM 15071]|uniref:Nitrilase n=1 Tax=Thiohalospira halophila DSM 15071 TaxID=1123397 RepID=A0A1I1QVP9_9GAMM|nr:carbon-nitrogen hydrolase family protein [Thiohalospira halophila]SFD26067.1 nitrilase [Thiohalospira halophila DSM 15071]